MAYAIHQNRELHMIQIDFTNALGSVPHGLIAFNMKSMGLPDIPIDTVMNIYEGATTVIQVPTGVTGPIKWKMDTVQGCLESFLRLMEKEEFRQYGFRVCDAFGNEVTSVNVAAYADEIILYSETRDGAQAMLDALADFCNYSGMEVNVSKCVSVSITWQDGHQEDQYQPFNMRKGRSPVDAQGMSVIEELAHFCHPEEIPVQEASVYLGLPLGAD
jgi:hypothetical protein